MKLVAMGMSRSNKVLINFPKVKVYVNAWS